MAHVWGVRDFQKEVVGRNLPDVAEGALGADLLHDDEGKASVVVLVVAAFSLLVLISLLVVVVVVAVYDDDATDVLLKTFVPALALLLCWC